MTNNKPYPISKVSPEDTQIELSCRSVKPVLNYFKEKYGQEKLEAFIYDTKMNIDYVGNENNWVSFAYYCRLLEKLVEYTGDSRSSFFVGTYIPKDGCNVLIENIIKRFGTPGMMYKLLADITPRYSKLSEISVSDIKKNSCVISIRYFDKFKQDKNNCLVMQGIYASLPAIWGLPFAEIEHSQCAVNGGNTCVYKIFWANRMYNYFSSLGIVSGLLIISIVKIFIWRVASPFVLAVIPVLGYFIGKNREYKIELDESMGVNEKNSKNLLDSIETIEKMNLNLQKDIEQRTEELNNSNKKLLQTLDELRNSQNQLVQSEKMASIGRLAAGMAHELNNPVGAVRNYIQDVIEDLPENDPRRERLRMAEKATGRCKRIVNDLLTFAREGIDLKLVNIKDVLETIILNEKKEALGSKIKILEEIAPDMPDIKVDLLQIQQVFMNIIMNAVEAVNGEGQIVIKAFNSAENIIVEISDSGKGIPEDIQEKIFDPFFTTKPQGKGTGLGLAISYNIIKRFNGDIQVRSEAGKGAIFRVTLPVK